MKSLYSVKPQKRLNCPQCAYPLPIYFSYTKLVECSSCHSSIFLGDEVAEVIGSSSALSPEPSLIELYKPIIYQKQRFIPIGKIRYSYGRGFWEEWFLKGDDNRGWWLSVDEGDFVLEVEEKLSTLGDFTFDIDSLKIGNFIGEYIVSEVANGRCEGFAGELPEKVEIGLVHKYVHLSGKDGELLTIEMNIKGRVTLYKGKWIDPFLLQRV